MSKLNSINQNSIYSKIYNRHSSQNSQIEQQKSRKSEKEETAINDQQEEKNNKNLLSNNEINTLHMFFGSKKPEEMQFYGNNQVDKIHKGQFLDLKG
jgi:DNA-binding PucR family transcriptional regulator